MLGYVELPAFCSDFLKMGLIGCSETSMRNYQYTLHNIPDLTYVYTESCRCICRSANIRFTGIL